MSLSSITRARWRELDCAREGDRRRGVIGRIEHQPLEADARPQRDLPQRRELSLGDGHEGRAGRRGSPKERSRAAWQGQRPPRGDLPRDRRGGLGSRGAEPRERGDLAAAGKADHDIEARRIGGIPSATSHVGASALAVIRSFGGLGEVGVTVTATV